MMPHIFETGSCFSIRQRYNLKANHNAVDAETIRIVVVFQYVKDTIWKQITTCFIRYASLTGCFSIRQRYNLKANHNIHIRSNSCASVVFQYVKDTIWKQITTVLNFHVLISLLFFNTSKIQFESKSQHFLCSVYNMLGCFSIRQRYNLKANHNTTHWLNAYHEVVFQYVKDTIWKQITTRKTWRFRIVVLFFNTSKIQFESKSQPACVGQSM